MNAFLLGIIGFFIGYLLGRYRKELAPIGKQFKKDFGHMAVKK